jgi:hypothetical protein
MEILNNLEKNIKVEAYDKPSTEVEIEAMLNKSPIELPLEFAKIIREKSEIEICINEEKILRIWGALGCIEMNETYNIQKYLPKAWAIGDDEGGYAIVYAQGNKGFGVYAVSFSDLDDSEKVYIAPSLYDLLVKGIGKENFISF